MRIVHDDFLPSPADREAARQQISAHVDNYLRRGGAINEIPRGMSGEMIRLTEWNRNFKSIEARKKARAKARRNKQ